MRAHSSLGFGAADSRGFVNFFPHLHDGGALGGNPRLPESDRWESNPRLNLACPPSPQRVTRIELAYLAWEASVLPLYYTRSGYGRRGKVAYYYCTTLAFFNYITAWRKHKPDSFVFAP